MAGARKIEIGCTEESKRDSLTLPTLLYPQGGTAQGSESSSRPVISPMGESKSVSAQFP